MLKIYAFNRRIHTNEFWFLYSEVRYKRVGILPTFQLLVQVVSDNGQNTLGLADARRPLLKYIK